MSEQDHAHARAADSLLEYYVNSGLSSFPDALSWNWFATTLQLARCCFNQDASGEAFTGNSGAAGRMWCSFKICALALIWMERVTVCCSGHFDPLPSSPEVLDSNGPLRQHKKCEISCLYLFFPMAGVNPTATDCGSSYDRW